MHKGHTWSRHACICEDSKYSKSFAHNSVFVGDEVIIVNNNNKLMSFRIDDDKLLKTKNHFH